MFNDISGKWEKIYQNIFKSINYENIISNDEIKKKWIVFYQNDIITKYRDKNKKKLGKITQLRNSFCESMN